MVATLVPDQPYRDGIYTHLNERPRSATHPYSSFKELNLLYRVYSSVYNNILSNREKTMKIIVLLLILSNYCFAEIIITPHPADSSADISIKIINQRGSEAFINAETITQTGNDFVINQEVIVACFLPSAPILESIFNVGNLNQGEYTVTVNIHNIGSPSSVCPDSTVTQNAAFSVSVAQIIPVGGFYWKQLLIVLLLFISYLFLRNKAKFNE